MRFSIGFCRTWWQHIYHIKHKLKCAAVAGHAGVTDRINTATPAAGLPAAGTQAGTQAQATAAGGGHRRGRPPQGEAKD